MPAHLNKTLISLIPKCPNPELLGIYRPISLRNSVFKIVRIHPFLDKLVSPMQATFVLRRRGLDNIIIA